MAERLVWKGTGVTTTVGSLSALAAAVAAASPGDTIQLSDGTYDWNAYWVSIGSPPGSSGGAITINKRIRVKSQNYRGAKLRGDTAAPATANADPAPAHRVYGLKVNNGDGAWVEDFDIAWFGVGIDVDNSNDVVIQGNLVESCQDVGISVFDAQRPQVHMNELRDPFLSGDTGGTLKLPGSVTEAQMDYGVYLFGTLDARVTHNYFFGIFNQACSFKEGNKNGYAGFNTFEGSLYTSLFFGQNEPGNGPYEHSGLPQGYDIGDMVAESNVFRPVVKDGKTYRMNTAMRVWHVDGKVTLKHNVVEAAIAGILIEGREGTEAGYATGEVFLIKNTIGGTWRDALGVLQDVAQVGIRLYKGVLAHTVMQSNALVGMIDPNPVEYCFDDGGIGPCPTYAEFATQLLDVPTNHGLTLRAPVTTYDPDLSYARTPLTRVATVADVPHMAWPFRVIGQRFMQVEQDSIEDVQQSVHAFLAAPKGSRPLNPDWGVDDPTFGMGVDTAELERDIEDSEDGRARATVSATGPDQSGRMDVTVQVELAE